MKIQLIRHATLLIESNGKKLLLDPMLSEQGAQPPVVNTANTLTNPLVPLPFDIDELLTEIDGIVVTHLHPDHLDEAAIQRLPKHLPVFCQPCDVATLSQYGFSQTMPVTIEVEWEQIRITRTGGQHGTGEIGIMMGPVSGFVFAAAGEPVLYVAGDTIWCEEVADALARYQPAFVVVNAGAAEFLQGGPITMNAADVIKVCQHAPDAHVLPVHLDTWNHCLEKRVVLHEALKAAELLNRVTILADGEVFASN